MSDRVPKDLFIFHGFGACHAEWGRTQVSIDANGKGLYEEGSGSLKLEDGQKGLLGDIKKGGFYNLNDSYHNLEVNDGGCEDIAITRNNSTKSDGVSNMAAPQAYERAAKIIIDMAENKTRSRTVELLIQALKDEDGFVRYNAAEALGKLNDTRAIEPLKSALNEEDEYFREAAASALTKLGWQAS